MVEDTNLDGTEEQSVASFLFDSPIEEGGQDELGMKHAAESLVATCLAQSNKSSLVVGVYGEWGSGKTSFINLIKKSLREQTKGRKRSNALVLVDFDPWLCDSVESMLRRFLVELASQAKTLCSKADRAKKVTATIVDYADLLLPLMVPVPGVDALLEPAKSALDKDKSIASLKKTVEKEFAKLNRRVFVFIDDIDRLPDEKVRAVFQLVNHVANFPNVTYVLAFDYQVVSAALDSTQVGNGAEYLSKIIQVSYSVPRFSKSVITRYFFQSIERWFADVPVTLRQNRIYSLQNDLLDYALCSLRDAKRIRNVFAINVSALGKELDLLDILAISVIEVWVPSFYEWIHRNKDLLCSPLDFSNRKAPEEYRKQLRDSLEASSIGASVGIDRACGILRLLFPKVANGGRVSSEFDAKASRRIASREYFDLYFSGDISSLMFEKAEIEAIVFVHNEGDAFSTVNSAIEKGKVGALLEEIRCHKNVITKESATKLVRPLASAFGKSRGEMRGGLFMLSPDSFLGFLIDDLLRTIGTPDADEVAVSAVRAMDLDNLIGAAEWINGIELAYGRLAAESENTEGQVISIEALGEIEALVAEKANAFSKDGGFLRRGGKRMLLYLWECFDKDALLDYWETQFKSNELAFAYFVADYSMIWNSSVPANGWSCKAEPVAGLPDYNEILPHLLALKGNPAIDELTDEELCKVITYAEAGPDSGPDSAFSEDAAMALMTEWRAHGTGATGVPDK